MRTRLIVGSPFHSLPGSSSSSFPTSISFPDFLLLRNLNLLRRRTPLHLCLRLRLCRFPEPPSSPLRDPNNPNLEKERETEIKFSVRKVSSGVRDTRAEGGKKRGVGVGLWCGVVPPPPPPLMMLLLLWSCTYLAQAGLRGGEERGEREERERGERGGGRR